MYNNFRWSLNVIYVIFSLLNDLRKLINYNDNNFIVQWNNVLVGLIDNIMSSLEMVTKWLRDSPMKVYELKTESCVFHHKDQHLLKININGFRINS